MIIFIKKYQSRIMQTIIYIQVGSKEEDTFKKKKEGSSILSIKRAIFFPWHMIELISMYGGTDMLIMQIIFTKFCQKIQFRN